MVRYENRYDWLNKFCNVYMAPLVNIINRCDIRIEACHRNKPNKSKLSLYIQAIPFRLTAIWSSYTYVSTSVIITGMVWFMPKHLKEELLYVARAIDKWLLDINNSYDIGIITCKKLSLGRQCTCRQNCEIFDYQST